MWRGWCVGGVGRPQLLGGGQESSGSPTSGCCGAACRGVAWRGAPPPTSHQRPRQRHELGDANHVHAIGRGAQLVGRRAGTLAQQLVLVCGAGGLHAGRNRDGQGQAARGRSRARGEAARRRQRCCSHARPPWEPYQVPPTCSSRCASLSRSCRSRSTRSSSTASRPRAPAPGPACRRDGASARLPGTAGRCLEGSMQSCISRAGTGRRQKAGRREARAAQAACCAEGTGVGGRCDSAPLHGRAQPAIRCRMGASTLRRCALPVLLRKGSDASAGGASASDTAAAAPSKPAASLPGPAVCCCCSRGAALTAWPCALLAWLHLTPQPRCCENRLQEVFICAITTADKRRTVCRAADKSQQTHTDEGLLGRLATSGKWSAFECGCSAAPVLHCWVLRRISR